MGGVRVTVRDHRGISAPFSAALKAAGWEIAGPIRDQCPDDILLIDHEVPWDPYTRQFDLHQRAFIYPHSPLPLPQVWPIHPKTRGRFVPAEGQAAHVTGNVAEIGWSFCDLAPFRPTAGRKILYAPFHPDGTGWLHPAEQEANDQAEKWLADLGADVAVRMGGGLSHADIDQADLLVAAVGTVPWLGIARGCPTIMYAQEVLEWGDVDQDGHQFGAGIPVHYPHDLSADVEQVCSEPVDGWRARWIGEPFDPVRFVALFERAVAEW